MYRNVSGYRAKYFPKSFHETAPRSSGLAAQFGFDMTPPPIPLQSISELLKWLSDCQFPQFGPTAKRFVVRSLKNEQGSTWAIDLSIFGAYVPGLHIFHHQGSLLVVGLIQTGTDLSLDDEAILGFCCYVEGAFRTRPERLFMHAFIIYNSTMEMWTFDRAGPYSGEAFDITEEPNRFRNILAEYMSMNDDELGMNPLVQEDDHGVFIELKGPTPSSDRKLIFNEHAFVAQRALLGPGTTCFKAGIRNFLGRELVVKFVWRRSEVAVERRLLELANEKNVWGIVELESYGDLGDIAQLRQGLQFDQAYLPLHVLMLPPPGGKTDDPNKYQELSDSLSESTLTGSPLFVSQSPESSPPEFPPLNQASERENEPENESENEPKFDNLKFECLVTSPFGRPLYSFSSPSELISVLGDVVRALGSLYFKANILHCNVNPLNIVIVPNHPNAPYGMLIDLDHAVNLSDPPSKLQLTGSEGFMALGVLSGDVHTYRHDLESVFYVFLSLAIWRTPNTIASRRVGAWFNTHTVVSFGCKQLDMHPAAFSSLVEEGFVSSFDQYIPLANKLHDLLFPFRNGKIFLGTDYEDEAKTALYEGMIHAFEENTSHIQI